MNVFVIAEAGVNHDGDLDVALELVDVAARSGADAVKFQTFRSKDVTVADTPKADYQRATTGESGSQRDLLDRLEMSEADFERIMRRCQERGVEFMSTAFDTASLDMLVKNLRMGRVKVPSGEMTNGPLLYAMGASGLPLIASTGMCTIEEVGRALAVLAQGASGGDPALAVKDAQAVLADPDVRELLASRVTLLHCTTEYPAPFDEINLQAMSTLAESFQLPVGMSDHSAGIAVPLAAVALGAVLIEKHFTLDRGREGPDHRASLEPAELDAMVAGIRQVSAALGDGRKIATASEIRNIPIARRALVAACPIRKGEALSADNLTAKRPAIGLSPMTFWDLLGTEASRDYAADEPIQEQP